jgi:hypothetical protein
MLCRIANSFYGTQRTVSRGKSNDQGQHSFVKAVSSWHFHSCWKLRTRSAACIKPPHLITHPRLPHFQPIFYTLPARFVFLTYLFLLSAAPNDTPSVVEFTEIVINPQKDHPRLSRMWKVRDTLNRSKITKKVINFKYEGSEISPLGTVIDDDNPPVNPFDCQDLECSECFSQFFPATTMINYSVAQQTMFSLTETIQEKVIFLRDALAAHTDFIVTRWRKKSRDKRLAFLEEHSALYPKKWAAIHLLNAVNYPHSEEEHAYYVGPDCEVTFTDFQTAGSSEFAEHRIQGILKESSTDSETHGFSPISMQKCCPRIRYFF